jgi:hypothetical protein
MTDPTLLSWQFLIELSVLEFELQNEKLIFFFLNGEP